MIQPNQPTPKPAPVRERHELLFAAYAKATAQRKRERDAALADCQSLCYWRCCGVHNLPAVRKTRGHVL